jgi:hypothetical protein
VAAYRRLADVISLKRQELEVGGKGSGSGTGGALEKRHSSINASTYLKAENWDDAVGETSAGENSSLVVEVSEVKVGFRRGETFMKVGKGRTSSNFDDVVLKA